jgi:hypothetical protein
MQGINNVEVDPSQFQVEYLFYSASRLIQEVLGTEKNYGKYLNLGVPRNM